MKLLIITQKIDKNDPILGFFLGWIRALAQHFESVVVICLERGEYQLPTNVTVWSLGKEANRSRFQYLFHFYHYLWQERKNYEAVFVHMNQEYVLLAGWWWRLTGKKVFMWRNHSQGNWLTDLATFFCNKVFCTSQYSYTAKYKKTVLMPVGIDLAVFKPDTSVLRKPNSILFLGRIAPAKNVDIFIETLGVLKNQSVNFSASIYGGASSVNETYLKQIKNRVVGLGLANMVKFYDGVPNYKTPKIYSTHEVYVNLSSSGMYDKTIFEAMACGCLVLASNDNLHGQIDERLIIKDQSAVAVANQLTQVLSLPVADKQVMIEQGLILAQKNNLVALADKLSETITS